jgi:hypothetical protein
LTPIELPKEIQGLFDARLKLAAYYSHISNEKGKPRLDFTFDGNLVGDIGEAIAHDFFGIKLDDARSKIGIDGTAVDGRTVQVKATGTKRGPAFRPTKVGADHLLFFCIDFENRTAEVVFNGPEEIAIGHLFSNPNATTQRMVTRKQIVSRNSEVNEDDRLPQLKPKT